MIESKGTAVVQLGELRVGDLYINPANEKIYAVIRVKREGLQFDGVGTRNFPHDPDTRVSYYTESPDMYVVRFNPNELYEEVKKFNQQIDKLIDQKVESMK